MTSLFPIDPVLPNVPMLFDGEAMRALIARHTNDADILAIRPTYVRYKPQTSCLVGYEIDIRTGGEVTVYHAHIRTFADDRGRRRMTNRKLEKLVDRADQECGAFPMARLTYLPELNGMLSFFPIDYDLRPLLKLATPGTARKQLRETLKDPVLDLVKEPEVIRYKPGRKALFRYTTSQGVMYGKIHADDRSGTIRAATDALRAAGLPTPAVLGSNQKLGFIVHAEARGAQLASLRDDPRYGDMLASLACPLARLHTTRLPDLPVHHLGNEIDRLRETGDLLGVILPKQRSRLDRIVRIIEDRLARVDDELATNHGDFYDDQAIVDESSIAIIDLDEIRIAHPMLDIGNMLAHLRTGEERGAVSPAAREGFIEAMRTYRPMTDRDIDTFTAIGILKLAPGPFRRLEQDWPEAIDGMIGMIEGMVGCGRPSPTKTPTVTDDKLPELPALQDPATMQARLREATGDPSLTLDGIHVQRHKPGRRAIVRYDVKNGEPVWGKLFASKRGPRVYEISRAICDAKAFGPDVALPNPIAFLTDLRVLLQRSVPGESIEKRLLEGDVQLADNIASAIHHLHASGLDLGREHDLAKELAPLPQRVDDLGMAVPHLHDEAVVVHARMLDIAGNVQHWRYLPIHRDFYDAQVLIDGGNLSVLDLDDAAMSEPAVDIANFAAHLDLLALRYPAHEANVARVRDRFLARSRELDLDLDGTLLSFLTASTMLRLAGIHAPRQDGERIAPGLIRQAAATLELLTGVG